MARCVPMLSFDVVSLFGGEKRSCRYMDMITAVSLVLRANKPPLSFSAQKDPMSVPLECIWYTLYVFPLTSKFQLSNFFPLLSPPCV